MPKPTNENQERMVREADLEGLYRGCKHLLLAIARRTVPSDTDAEDVLHAAFTHFLQRGLNLKPDEAKRYLVRCTCSAAADWWRDATHRERARQIAVADAYKDDPETPLSSAEEQDEFNVLRRAVSELPDRQRQAVLLRYFGGLSADESSSIMRRRPATVRSLLRHAIDRLRVSLSPNQSVRTIGGKNHEKA